MTSDRSKPPDPDDPLASLEPATREALSWLGHLQSGEATEQDRRDYEAWRAAAPENARAAERAREFWDMLGPALAGVPLGKPKKGGPKRVPAIVLALAAFGAAFAGGLFGPPQAYFADESTGVGERRAITLADGSRVELDTRTSLDVAEGGRRLTLHGGQIFVVVARDPTRPFVVRSGGGSVEAVGTAFAVRRDEASTRIVVTESRVRVRADREGGPSPSVEIAAGQETGYGAQTGPVPPRPSDLRARTAWRAGELSFDDQPLGDVMAEVGRYRRGAVLFTDDALRRFRVTGVFRVDDLDGLLDAVAKVTPVVVRRLPWLTVIRRDPARTPPPADR